MDMAPVSLPLYLGSGDETASPVDLKARKRISVHLPQDVETPRRLSLTFNSARRRSLSESWALSSPVSTNSTGFTTLLLSSASSSSLMTPPPSLPSSPLSALYQATPLSSMSNDTTSTVDGISQVQEQEQEQDQDQDLLKSLASFLQKHDNQTQVELPGAALTTLTSTSAGPIDTESTSSDLVVRVRDFAYPKSHLYHLGHFPPAPAYEESDVEEDDEPMGWYSEDVREEDHAHFFHSEEESDDRTHGQARGLYDFDAETDTELSFREGEYLWIHSRQFPGWFLGEIAGVTGLVPENYVQIL
ncbi:HOG (high osmolarity glycerol) pathway protein [Podila clonocystis]|nr:HOG (high osmolarity glycerol) pathway protein [Podila clonocystis]